MFKTLLESSILVSQAFSCRGMIARFSFSVGSLEGVSWFRVWWVAEVPHKCGVAGVDLDILHFLFWLMIIRDYWDFSDLYELSFEFKYQNWKGVTLGVLLIGVDRTWWVRVFVSLTLIILFCDEFVENRRSFVELSFDKNWLFLWLFNKNC